MLIEYLQSENPVRARWIDDIPGTRICQFTLSDLPEKKFLTVPGREPHHVFEIFFCLAGQIIAEIQNAEPHKIERHQILILANTAELRTVKISDNLQGILISIDSQQPMEKSALSVCTSLGLHMDLCQLKSKMDTQHGYTTLCDNGWTQAVFDLLAFLPEEECGRYCLLKAMELLYILAEKNYGIGYLTREDEQIVQSVLKARLYMETHLSEKITISDLCHMLSVSPTYLKTMFRRIYGMSVHRCLMNLRMQRAGDLIRRTEQPIYQIAQMVGYEGMSQFSAAFKQYYGVTPGIFKRMSKTATECPFR